jgi:hypothetical protein
MDLPTDELNCYCVEVSGWDARENFFVEKTSLDWAREGRKEISLNSPLRNGCVVFVRLIQSMTQGNNFPVAYEAVTLDEKNSLGRARVSLQPLRPRSQLNGREVSTDLRLQLA